MRETNKTSEHTIRIISLIARRVSMFAPKYWSNSKLKNADFNFRLKSKAFIIAIKCNHQKQYRSKGKHCSIYSIARWLQNDRAHKNTKLTRTQANNKTDAIIILKVVLKPHNAIHNSRRVTFHFHKYFKVWPKFQSIFYVIDGISCE